MEWGTVKLGYRVNGYTEITIDPDISKGEDQQQMDVTSSPHRVVISGYCTKFTGLAQVHSIV